MRLLNDANSPHFLSLVPFSVSHVAYNSIEHLTFRYFHILFCFFNSLSNSPPPQPWLEQMSEKMKASTFRL